MWMRLSRKMIGVEMLLTGRYMRRIVCVWRALLDCWAHRPLRQYPVNYPVVVMTCRHPVARGARQDILCQDFG